MKSLACGGSLDILLRSSMSVEEFLRYEGTLHLELKPCTENGKSFTTQFVKSTDVTVSFNGRQRSMFS